MFNKLVMFLVFAGICLGHGVDGHGYELLGRDDTIQIEQPVEGASEFARRLAVNAQYIFTCDELDILHTANTHFKYAGQNEKNAEETIARRHYTLGQQKLAELLEGYDNTIEFDVSDGYTKPFELKPVKVRAEHGTLILKVIAGSEGGRYTKKKVELEARSEHEPPVNIDIEPGKVNWIALSFWNVPRDNCAVLLSFDDGSREYPAAVKVYSPQMGEVEIKIFGQTGRPTPAMVRLVSIQTQTLYRPANSVVFDWQMDNIAGYPEPDLDIYPDFYGKPYRATMPRPYGGYFWCVPGPFDMAIPEGDWEIFIMRGFEHVPVNDKFTIESGKKKSLSYTVKRWIDMPAKGWYSGDDHIHSRMLSDTDAEKLMALMHAADLHVGNILMMGNSYRTVFEQRGYGPEYRTADGDRVLVPGQEDPRCFYGHGIGLNLVEQFHNEDKYIHNEWLADKIHSDGGLYGHAHVLFNIFNIIRDICILLPQGKSDFGEIMQSGLLDTELYYDFLDLGCRFTAGTGSDMPFGHVVGEAFMYAHLENPFTVDKWFDAVKAGRTFVTNGPLIEFTVDGHLPGDVIEVGKSRGHTIKVKASGIPGISAPREILVVSLSEVIGRAVSEEPSKSELEYAMQIDSGFGRWVAVKVNGFNDSEAHSSPVYIHREGFRWWNVDRAQYVIDRCREVLDGMEAELEGFMAQDKSGFAPGNLFGPHMAKMAPEAIETFHKMQKFYDDLEDKLNQEKALRSSD
jgi:hypothetical protein